MLGKKRAYSEWTTNVAYANNGSDFESKNQQQSLEEQNTAAAAAAPPAPKTTQWKWALRQTICSFACTMRMKVLVNRIDSANSEMYFDFYTLFPQKKSLNKWNAAEQQKYDAENCQCHNTPKTKPCTHTHTHNDRRHPHIHGKNSEGRNEVARNSKLRNMHVVYVCVCKWSKKNFSMHTNQQHGAEIRGLRRAKWNEKEETRKKEKLKRDRQAKGRQSEREVRGVCVRERETWKRKFKQTNKQNKQTGPHFRECSPLHLVFLVCCLLFAVCVCIHIYIHFPTYGCSRQMQQQICSFHLFVLHAFVLHCNFWRVPNIHHVSRFPLNSIWKRFVWK